AETNINNDGSIITNNMPSQQNRKDITSATTSGYNKDAASSPAKANWKFIRLKGYIKSLNPEQSYDIAKEPVDTGWQSIASLTPAEINAWQAQGGLIGIQPPPGVIIVDVDNAIIGKAICDHVDRKELPWLILKTPRGYQFIFSNPDEQGQSQKAICAAGFEVDYRT